MHTLEVPPLSIKKQSFDRNLVKTRSYYIVLKLSNFYEIIRPWLTEAKYAKRRSKARRRCLWKYSSAVQEREIL